MSTTARRPYVGDLDPDEIEQLRAAVPPLVLGALDRYVADRIPTGNFTRAVLCNDLAGALEGADPQSTTALRDILWYVRWCLPGACWGSREKVDRWLSEAQR